MKLVLHAHFDSNRLKCIITCLVRTVPWNIFMNRNQVFAQKVVVLQLLQIFLGRLLAV